MVLMYNNGVDNLAIEVEPKECTAYYFSKAEKRITGDVWLFNIGETPEKAPWDDTEEWEGPYQNSSDYCYPHDIQLPILESDFDVQFAEGSETFGIYFRGKLVGILGTHQRPGKSSFARQNSPVAKAMDQGTPRAT